MSIEQQLDLPSPTSIADNKNQETVKTTRTSTTPIFKRQKAWKNYVTTDVYVDSVVMDARFFKNKLFHIINTHAANDLKYTILACVDPSQWHELLAETILAAATSGFQVDDGAWSYYKIQVKSSVAVTPATVTAFMSEGQI